MYDDFKALAGDLAYPRNSKANYGSWDLLSLLSQDDETVHC